MANATTLETKSKSPSDVDQIRLIVILTVLVVLLLGFYWNTLKVISTVWSQPEYSHGWLVPLFAGLLLWMRREPIVEADDSARVCGVGLLAFGLLTRLAATNIGVPYIDMISLIPCLFGIFLLVGGWGLLKWSGPAIAFLVFMYPLPNFVSRELLDPLQRMATVCSTYALQTLGIAAHRSGNQIVLGELRLGVVEACSGLRMSTIFLAMTVAVTLITNRPWWERIVIVLSAVPIALLVNVIRITSTGILYQLGFGKAAEEMIHDLAGWIMMPMAIGFLFLELQLLANLFIEEEDKGPVSLAPMATAGPRLR